MTDPFAFAGAAEIIAHRGYSARAPENTLVALEAALRAGADALEFDLQCTADGLAVLIHDDDLGRTTDGRGSVRATRWETLRQLDAGSWFAKEFAGEPVPTLEDVLRSVGARSGRLYPELKGFGRVEDLARIVDTITSAGVLERTVAISMDWEALGLMRTHAPTLCVGYIVEAAERAAEALERAEGDALALVDFDARLLLADPTLAEKAHARGIAMAAWTVDDPCDATRLLEVGVPRITTNQVGSLLAWKASL